MTTARRIVEDLVAVLPTDAHLDEEDVDEDVWDVRFFPGARYDRHRSSYTLTFTPIPVPYRTMVKQYIKLRLLRCSYASCRQHLQYLPHFFAFHEVRTPGAALSRSVCGRYDGVPSLSAHEAE